MSNIRMTRVVIRSSIVLMRCLEQDNCLDLNYSSQEDPRICLSSGIGPCGGMWDVQNGGQQLFEHLSFSHLPRLTLCCLRRSQRLRRSLRRSILCGQLDCCRCRAVFCHSDSDKAFFLWSGTSPCVQCAISAPSIIDELHSPHGRCVKTQTHHKWLT